MFNVSCPWKECFIQYISCHEQKSSHSFFVPLQSTVYLPSSTELLLLGPIHS